MGPSSRHERIHQITKVNECGSQDTFYIPLLTTVIEVWHHEEGNSINNQCHISVITGTVLLLYILNV